MRMTETEREDIEALLPWHAAGSLNRRDTERVEKALAGDRELARRLDLAHEELRETIRLNETLGAPSARVTQRLFAAIGAEPARAGKILFDLTGRLARFLAGVSPRAVAWSAFTAAVVIVLQAGIITTGLIKQQAGQVTELASAGGGDQKLAVIRFAPKADAADIARFLATNKISVVDGPKSGGMYTIRLPETGKAKDDLIQQMQAQSAIVEFITTVR
jgi:hypothetical protein